MNMVRTECRITPANIQTGISISPIETIETPCEMPFWDLHFLFGLRRSPAPLSTTPAGARAGFLSGLRASGLGFEGLRVPRLSISAFLSKRFPLVPSFLQKFKVLEHQFQELIPANTILDQFEFFLSDKYGIVKNMTEGQFVDYMINVESGDAYKDLIK